VINDPMGRAAKLAPAGASIEVLGVGTPRGQRALSTSRSGANRRGMR